MINCIIIDDEPHSIETLEDHISKCDGLNLLKSFKSPITAIKFLESPGRLDLVFLDVDMPDLSGFELAQFLPANTAIIYVTAHSKYAIQAFETNVYDFLLKPVSFVNFLKSVNKIKAMWYDRSIPSDEKSDYFFINPGVKGKMIKIEYKNIIYIEGLKNYVIIHVEGNKFITYLTMHEVEESLPADQFFRIHRSYIINTKRIKSVEGNILIFSEDLTFPLGGVYKESVMNFINKNSVITKRKD